MNFGYDDLINDTICGIPREDIESVEREIGIRESSKDYTECIYWDEATGECTGFNCCVEKGCPNAAKYQPWLRDEGDVD